jgi:hypothetical protein
VPSVGAGQRLLTRMNTDVLRFTESRTAVSAKKLRRLGRFEFCEEDYQQLQLWARQRTGVSAEDLANYLAHEALAKSIIDPELQWLERGRIKAIRIGENFWAGWKGQFRALDLSRTPQLVTLLCDYNHLTELDLSNVPLLTTLSCVHNQLTELNLSNLPLLRSLSCWANQLKELDLSNVPSLTGLFCNRNQLTKLDLTNVPLLKLLFCANNRLSRLDVSNLSMLIDMLDCEGNFLTELDIRNCPGLEIVRCDRGVKITKAPSHSVRIRQF